MSDRYIPCLNHFGFGVRATEQAELCKRAAAAGMSKAAYVRSRIPEVFEPAVPGRKWSSDPAQRHRCGSSVT
jgi:hypothetical protein